MDEKIVKELVNFDVRETEQLLNTVNADDFREEIDEETRNRIRTSVLKKAGVITNKNKKAFIPKITKIFVVSLLISIVELLFFTSFAFVAWMDGFLGNSGINLSFSGKVPAFIYIVMLGALALCVYKVMFHVDSEKYSINMILPTNRTSIIYAVYLLFSFLLKIFIYINFGFIVYLLEDIIPYRSEFVIILWSLLLLCVILAVLDMILAKLKNSIILRFDAIDEFQYKWKLSMKSFWIEFLKYFGIFGYIISVLILGRVDRSKITAFFSSFAVFLALNIFMTIIVQLKKRCCLKVETKQEKSLAENKTKKPEAEVIDRRLILKRRIFILGLSATAAIYLFCLFIPYMFHPGLTPQKPLLETFSNRDEVESFFANRSIPFMAQELTTDVINVTESLFMFNKLIIGAMTNKPDLRPLVTELISRTEVALFQNNSQSVVSEGTKSEDTYSTTNTQVERVDEADVIKTDGEYVYYLNGSKLYIVDAYPPEYMETIYKYDFLEEGLYPIELYLYEDYIALILTSDKNYQLIGRHTRYSYGTVVRTYNVLNPANPILERSFELDYPYLTSRMIENNLYIVATSYINYSKSKPKYTDSAIDNNMREIHHSDLYLMRGNVSQDYRQINVVAALPVDKPYTKAQVKGYVGGGGEKVYVSTEHIYIVESTSNAITETSVGEFFYSLTDEEANRLNFLKYGTSIYRIKIQDGNIGDFDSAFVRGEVHNQFSMDEYDGYFRITTQKGKWQYASSNVYVLDSDMNVCGSLEGLAPGESIYASRFMGDRLYLVTFKVIDPLFVISLKDPKKPTVLGELKIPGYSEYLHPLDENHIIGFGKDTAGGNENFSFSQGIKMAIFDVSDVNNPKEKFVEIIGDRGTQSELLRNHKALMYMKNLELMAFPVKLYERREVDSYKASTEFSFQGAYVYNVNSTDGFKLRGKITHLDPNDDIVHSQSYQFENTSYIDRIIYANDSLYTFSGDKVKATRYSDMKDISEITLD